MTPIERMDLSRCWNDTQRKEIRGIADDGCAVVKVIGREGSAEPEWAYTVGLWHSYEHPEVLIIGLPHDQTQVLLHNINNRIRNQNLSFRDGTVKNDVIEGFDCFFQTIPPENYEGWFAANQWFYGGDDFPAVQMIWPDVHGVYPWQNAASTHFKEAQPILSSLPKRFRN